MLRLSPISKQLLIKAIAKEADLPMLATQTEITENEIGKLFDLLKKVKSTHRNSRILRFFAYKTSVGMDQHPDPMFSVAHLFEPSSFSYSSVALTPGLPAAA